MRSDCEAIYKITKHDARNGIQFRETAQLDPTGSCYVGLKQRENLEDKGGKTNFCQYLYKKC